MHGVYSGADCMKTFFQSFKEHLLKINNFERKENDAIKKQRA